MCWNLIVFAAIGAVFAIWAMYLVEPADCSEIALLYLGLVGGYAASIKELDMARMEVDKLRATSVDCDDNGPEEHERDDRSNRGQ